MCSDGLVEVGRKGGDEEYRCAKEDGLVKKEAVTVVCRAIKSDIGSKCSKWNIEGKDDDYGHEGECLNL